MELISDFLLLAATASACFYCYVLGGKLNKLKSSRNGIAASLASLSKSVEDAQTTIAHAHLAAEKSVTRLGPLLEEAAGMEEKLSRQLAAVEAALDAIVAARAEAMHAQVASGVPTAGASSSDDRPDDPASETDETSDDDFSTSDIDVDLEDDFEIDWSAPDGEAASDVAGGRDVISLKKASA